MTSRRPSGGKASSTVHPSAFVHSFSSDLHSTLNLRGQVLAVDSITHIPNPDLEMIIQTGCSFSVGLGQSDVTFTFCYIWNQDRLGDPNPIRQRDQKLHHHAGRWLSGNYEAHT